MRVVRLRDFFLGHVPARDIAQELSQAVVRGQDTTKFRMDGASCEDGGFEVRAEHLIRACDAFLDGMLDVDALEFIGFCITAGEAFKPTGDAGGERVADAALWWAAPIGNFDLTATNVARMREYLETGKPMMTVGVSR